MTRRHREYLVSQGVPPGLSGLPRKWTVAAEPGAMGGGEWIRRDSIWEKWKVTMCSGGNENSNLSTDKYHQGKDSGKGLP